MPSSLSPDPWWHYKNGLMLLIFVCNHVCVCVCDCVCVKCTSTESTWAVFTVESWENKPLGPMVPDRPWQAPLCQLFGRKQNGHGASLLLWLGPPGSHSTDVLSVHYQKQQVQHWPWRITHLLLVIWQMLLSIATLKSEEKGNKARTEKVKQKVLKNGMSVSWQNVMWLYCSDFCWHLCSHRLSYPFASPLWSRFHDCDVLLQ